MSKSIALPTQGPAIKPLASVVHVATYTESEVRDEWQGRELHAPRVAHAVRNHVAATWAQQTAPAAPAKPAFGKRRA